MKEIEKLLEAIDKKLEMRACAQSNVKANAAPRKQRKEETREDAPPEEKALPREQNEIPMAVRIRARGYANRVIMIVRGETKAEKANVLIRRKLCSADEADKFVTRITSMSAIDEIIRELEKRIIEEMRRAAASANSQDEFAIKAENAWGIERESGRKLYKALRDYAGERETRGVFAEQVEALLDEKTDKRQDPAKGLALKQLKKDTAANKQCEWLQIARRIARGLAQHGPITIDDVTLAMSRDYAVEAKKGNEAHDWKGSVFSTSEWSAVGKIASRIPQAHGRAVTLWALKGWLETNALNGRGDAASAFNLARIFNEFKRTRSGVRLELCNWAIGGIRLAPDVRETIVAGKNSLYGVPVTIMPDAVGAILILPQDTTKN